MVNKLGFDEFGRPCKSLYMMNLCFNIALRSLDPSTKCGCVITDSNASILSTGYNGPPIHSLDINMPLEAPDKYFVFEHSERNAIYLAARRGTPLENSIFFITGLPCMDCLRGIIQVGASKVIYGPLTAKMTDEEYLKKYTFILSNRRNFIIQKFNYLEGLLKLSPFISDIIKDRPFIDIQKYI